MFCFKYILLPFLRVFCVRLPPVFIGINLHDFISCSGDTNYCRVYRPQFAERSQPDRLCLVFSAVNQASLVSCLVRLLPVTLISFRFPVQHHCTRATSPLVYGVPSPLRRPWLNPDYAAGFSTGPMFKTETGPTTDFKRSFPVLVTQPVRGSFRQRIRHRRDQGFAKTSGQNDQNSTDSGI